MENIVLVCDVHENNGIFTIEFPYGDKKISLKSNNIDYTLKYLENIFLNSEKKVKEKTA